jgi:VanZ family protein
LNLLVWLPVAVYMAAIFYVSAQSSLPGRGGIPDYVLHGGEYFGLAVLTFRAIAGGLPARVTTARARSTMLIAAAYAFSDELHQYFVPFRTADIRDFIYDVAGAALALIACRAWHIISSPKSQIPDSKFQTPR